MEYLVYETQRTIEHETTTHYGICCRHTDGFVVTEALSAEREEVMALAQEMNSGELDMAHMEDVLNDWIIENSLATQLQ